VLQSVRLRLSYVIASAATCAPPEPGRVPDRRAPLRVPDLALQGRPVGITRIGRCDGSSTGCRVKRSSADQVGRFGRSRAIGFEEESA
jgi:hypothetical protein